MGRQPDDRSWEEEHIHHLNVDIDRLQKQLALAEIVISRIRPSCINQKQMIDSYNKFKLNNQ